MPDENVAPDSLIAPADDTSAAGADEPFQPTFDLSIYVEPQGIVCQFQCEGRREEWILPRTLVRRAHKAMTIDYLFDLLGAGPIVGYYLREAATNEPEFLIVPRAANALTDRVTKALRRVFKAQQKPAQDADASSFDEEPSATVHS